MSKSRSSTNISGYRRTTYDNRNQCQVQQLASRFDAFHQEWHGPDEEIVARREALRKKLITAQDTGDGKIARVQVGNATGLISSVEPATDIVRRIVEEPRQSCEAILKHY